MYCSCHISYNAYIYGFLQHILELASQHTCKKNYEKHRLVSGYSVDYVIKTGYKIYGDTQLLRQLQIFIQSKINFNK